MKILLHQSTDSLHPRVSATFEFADRTTDVFFESADIELRSSPEAFLALGLLLAMRSGEDIEIDHPIRGSLLVQLDTIQAILNAWNRNLHKVNVRAAGTLTAAQPPRERVGLFYSGGLDSAYGLLKNRHRVTDLIMVHGVDTEDKCSLFRRNMADSISKVSSDFRKNSLNIETNVRTLLDPVVDWGYFGHGAALVSVAYILSHELDSVIISSSYSYAALHPWGTHPLLDPEWSTENLTILHDGCEATRVDKAKAVKDVPVLMETLLVCWEHRNELPNCGICDKCVRTMVDFLAAGHPGKCPFFPHELHESMIHRIPRISSDSALFMRENLQALEQQGCREDIQRAIRMLLTRSARNPSFREYIRYHLSRRPNLHDRLRRLKRIIHG